MKFTDSLLVKYTFLEFLEREFGIQLKEEETEKIELAKQSIEIYDSMEEFYQTTGWQRDNPAESGREYLLEHKILADIQGRLWYFSRIRYEDGLKCAGESNCT